ncbi:MAG: DNA methyltransferase [Bradymonadales bacterium]
MMQKEERNHKDLASSSAKLGEVKHVSCLGLEFESEEARRAHFVALLRQKMQLPSFRELEGFPLASDESILALSDPPYYCACPNPWIADFIARWEAEKTAKPAHQCYQREAFAADVLEGKNDPIYSVHSYHTKVPPRAIMRYILHYTEPGDIILDGFCGSGMTGVAARLCGDRDAVASLGYQVKADATILREERGEDGKKRWCAFSKLGARKALLNDLSPAATFIAHNYNTALDLGYVQNEARRILNEVNEECAWLYETLHSDGKSKGRINYVVWSEVLICPNCTREFVFWDVAVKLGDGVVLKDFPCPHCAHWLSKKPAKSSLGRRKSQKTPKNQRPSASKAEKAWTSFYDAAIGERVKQVKQVPVLISYFVGGKNYKKVPSSFDLELLDKIDAHVPRHWFPTNAIQKGDKSGDHFSVGVTHVHHFYSKRNLVCAAAIWARLPRNLKWLATSFLSRNLTKCNRYVVNAHNPNGRINGPLTGTLYIPSEFVEQSALVLFESKITDIAWNGSSNLIQTASASHLVTIPSNSLDYVFIDPPFGANIMYSELNFIGESWLSVLTCNLKEAIENKSQKKGINDYRKLMHSCFKEAFRVLKSGHWITMEFSNTRAEVWNSVQNALSDAGFIVGNVSILNKKHGGIKAMSNQSSVKQDLVVSAYKPMHNDKSRWRGVAKKDEFVWEFVDKRLENLAFHKGEDAKLSYDQERDPRTLFDQMVAYCVRNGLLVPISSQDFQIGLAQRYIERDGMFFLPQQLHEFEA